MPRYDKNVLRHLPACKNTWAKPENLRLSETFRMTFGWAKPEKFKIVRDILMTFASQSGDKRQRHLPVIPETDIHRPNGHGRVLGRAAGRGQLRADRLVRGGGGAGRRSHRGALPH